jgi:hypothetical protein
MLENMSGSALLTVNGRPVRKQAKLALQHGDEIAIAGSRNYAFVSTLLADFILQTLLLCPFASRI